MAQENAYMPLWVGDYLADTQHLSTAEHGAYLLLIMHYWRNGPLPTEKRKLMRITGLSRYKVCEQILSEFFTLSDGRWHQKRIDQEIEKNQEYRASRARAGKAGADARWKNGAEKDIANASESQCESNGTHTHTHTQPGKYIYHGKVLRITSKSLGQLTKEFKADERDVITEIQKADQYYDAKIADGEEKETLRFSQTAWFKLRAWLGNNTNKTGVSKAPKIRPAI